MNQTVPTIISNASYVKEASLFTRLFNASKATTKGGPRAAKGFLDTMDWHRQMAGQKWDKGVSKVKNLFSSTPQKKVVKTTEKAVDATTDAAKGSDNFIGNASSKVPSVVAGAPKTPGFLSALAGLAVGGAKLTGKGVGLAGKGLWKAKRPLTYGAGGYLINEAFNAPSPDTTPPTTTAEDPIDSEINSILGVQPKDTPPPIAVSGAQQSANNNAWYDQMHEQYQNAYMRAPTPDARREALKTIQEFNTGVVKPVRYSNLDTVPKYQKQIQGMMPTEDEKRMIAKARAGDPSEWEAYLATL